MESSQYEFHHFTYKFQHEALYQLRERINEVGWLLGAQTNDRHCDWLAPSDALPLNVAAIHYGILQRDMHIGNLSTDLQRKETASGCADHMIELPSPMQNS